MQFTTLLLLSATYFKATFRSNQTNKTFKIYHKINCKSSFAICLLEYYICNIQYMGKSETPFNIRLSNHRKDVRNPNAIRASKQFNRHNHDWWKNHYRTTKKHPHTVNWDIKRKIKTVRKLLNNNTWDISATWSKPRPKLNPFHAGFPFNSIIFWFCILSKISGISHKMTSNILQHLWITNSAYPLRTATAETS